MNKLLPLALALPLALPTLPAAAQQEKAAESSGMPSWLGAVGDFIVDGIEPPRTAADLAREEEAARQAALKAAAQPPAPQPPAAKPAPETAPMKATPEVAAPAPAPATVSPPPSPPAITAPKMRTPVIASPTVAPPVPAAAPAIAQPVRPAPKPIVLPPSAPMALIPASDRIAGTATLDQARKLKDKPQPPQAAPTGN